MRLIKEMLHIDKLKPSLNKQKQSYYNCLLLGSKIKKKTRLVICIDFNLWLFIYQFLNNCKFLSYYFKLSLHLTHSYIY